MPNRDATRSFLKLLHQSFRLLITTICLVLTASDISFAQQAQNNTQNLKPLSQYLDNISGKDTPAILYIYDRCQALFMSLAVSTKNDTSEASQKFVQQARQAYVSMSLTAAELILRSTKDPDTAQKQHADIVKNILPIYIKIIEQQYTLGRSPDEDPLFSGDLFVCGEFLKK